MDTEKKNVLRLGYSGSLGYYLPGKKPKRTGWRNFLQYFWTYTNADEEGASLTSPYYLFKALQLLKERYPETARSVKVELWGMIESRNEALVKKLSLSDMVTISGYMTKQESLRKLAQQDVMMLFLKGNDKGNPALALPGKMFEYMRAGRPVLALMAPSDCSAFLERAGIGIRCDPTNIPAIADTIHRLFMDKDRLGTLYLPDKEYISGFSYDRLAVQMAGEFGKLLGNGK